MFKNRPKGPLLMVGLVVIALSVFPVLGDTGLLILQAVLGLVPQLNIPA